MSVGFQTVIRDGWLVLIPEFPPLQYGIFPGEYMGRTVDFRINHGSKAPNSDATAVVTGEFSQLVFNEHAECVPVPSSVEPERKKSTHKVEVVPLALEKHPNADTLSIARVFGFSCVTGTDQWAGKDRAAYLPPDSLVDVSRPEFSFLAKDANADGKARIKAKKLRGVLSFGLLVPAPEGASVGDDVADRLGVEHHEPPAQGEENDNGGRLFPSGEVAAGPDVFCAKYGLDAGRRYAHQVFTPGELVVVTEKVHGNSARYVYHGGKMYCGSRKEWKKEFPNYDHVTVEGLLATGRVDEERAKDIVARLKNSQRVRNVFWRALDATPAVREFCERHPGLVVYGEVYGVKDLSYGRNNGEVSFAAFDLMQDGKWLDFEVAYGMATAAGVPWVPVLEDGMAYDFDKVCEMAEGKSLVPGAGHVREGCVVKPVDERYDKRLGRVVLKWVGAGYLERSK